MPVTEMKMCQEREGVQTREIDSRSYEEIFLSTTLLYHN